MADTLELSSKDNGRTFKGITLDGRHNAINADGVSNVTFQDCTFLNCSGGAIGMIRCKGVNFINVDVHGAGLGEWNARGADCFNIKQSSGFVFDRVRTSGASHDCYTVLGCSDFLFKGCVIGKLDPRCHAQKNGASGGTFKRNSDNMRWEDCYITGAPDGQHSVVNPESGTQFHAYGLQLSGKGHVIRRCVFEGNAGGLLISSDKEPYFQVWQGALVEDVWILDCSTKNDPSGHPAAGIMMQQGGPAGSISGNTFRRVHVYTAQQLTHLALIGQDETLFGNAFESCEFGNGPLVVGGSSFATVENAAGRYSAFRGSRTIATRPTPGGGGGGNGGGGGGNGGGGTEKTMLKEVSPQPAKVGETLILRGDGLGDTRYVVLPTKAAPVTNERFNATMVTGAEVRCAVPPDAVTGEVWLTSNAGIRSNHLPFAVGTAPVPPPPPPDPQPNVTGYSGGQSATLVEPGAEFSLIGGNFIASAQVRWKDQALPVLSMDADEIRVKAPTVTGAAPVIVIQGTKSGQGPLLCVVAKGVVPQPEPTTVPVLESLTPISAKVGDEVVASGEGFGNFPDVLLNGVMLTNTRSRENVEVRFTVPSGAVTGAVAIRRTNDGKVSNSLPLTVEQAQPLPAAPVLTSLQPAQAAPGERVILAGSGFGTAGWAMFGGPTGRVGAQSVAWSDTRLEVIVPPAVVTGPVYVDRTAPSVGRSGSLTFVKTNPQPVPTPSAIFEAHGTAEDQAKLMAPIGRIFFPWEILLTDLQREGKQRIALEFADLSHFGVLAQALQKPKKKARALFATDLDEQTLEVLWLDGRPWKIRVGTESRILALADDGHDHGEDEAHILYADRIPGLPDEGRKFVAGVAYHGKIQIEQRMKEDTGFVAAVLSAEAGHEIDFYFCERRNLHPPLLRLLGATTEWWWGSYQAEYFRQPGESWMAGFGLAYSDVATEDHRFNPYFRASQAAEIRSILGVERTDR